MTSRLAALAAVSDDPPDVVLIGAEVGELYPFSDRLSAPLETALPTAVRLVLRECEASAGDGAPSRVSARRAEPQRL